MDIKNLSVVTVCYNAEKNIEKTFNSILKQTTNDFEYIIVDGGSTDSTKKIIEKYKNAFLKKNIPIQIISEPDKGIYDAMNKGIILCNNTGYLFFINAGDELYDENVLELFNDYSRKKDADVIFGLVQILMDNKMSLIMRPIIENNKFSFCHQSVFIKTTIARTHLFNLKYTYAADRDMILKVITEGYSYTLIGLVISKYTRDGFSSRNYSELYLELDEINTKYRILTKKHSYYVSVFKDLIVRFFPLLSDIVFIKKRLHD